MQELTMKQQHLNNYSPLQNCQDWTFLSLEEEALRQLVRDTLLGRHIDPALLSKTKTTNSAAQIKIDKNTCTRKKLSDKVRLILGKVSVLRVKPRSSWGCW